LPAPRAFSLRKSLWPLWRRRFVAEEPLRAKLEAYELALDEAVGRAVEQEAGELLHRLFQEYRSAIARLNDVRRPLYNDLHAVARHEEAGTLDIPTAIAVDVPPDAEGWPHHLFVDEEGRFRAKLNGWEENVLGIEMDRPDFLTWVRNPDRKPWSLAVPYTLGGRRLPGYPDFIIVRGTLVAPIFDILEPHQGEDSVAKAKGLADFADRHGGAFGRIELIRIKGESVLRLDLNDHRVRQAVLPIQSADELTRLFDKQA
jgi:type III restriction enzyme